MVDAFQLAIGAAIFLAGAAAGYCWRARADRLEVILKEKEAFKWQ